LYEDEAIIAWNENLDRHSLNVSSSNESDVPFIKRGILFKDQLSFLKNVETCSPNNFTIMFLQKLDFAFWKIVQHMKVQLAAKGGLNGA